MRIIAGSAKGLSLQQPKSKDVRPTRDMVKEALFSMLEQDIKDARFLDLYAGSGTIGLEALSRGAQEVVFIDKQTAVLKENMLTTKLAGGRIYTTMVANALKIIAKKKEKFDIIFLDPPYYSSEASAALKMLSGFDILAQNGLIILEHDPKYEPEIENIELIKKKKYGQTALSFFKKKACLEPVERDLKNEK
jgi:16S rRNA (guanine966-N2)-methyltransferase